MVLKDMPTIRIGQLMLNFAGTNGGHPANFVPFTTIVPYVLGHKGWIIAGVNLIGNIVLLIPVGFLIPFIFPNITWKKSLAIALSSGLLFEILQTVLNVGIFDIDDVILNALGTMIGYWAFIILIRWLREKKYMHILASALLCFVAAAGAIYAIYPHGQPVVSPEMRGGNNNPLPNDNDLCGGTGGTGEIVNMDETSITIRRKDGFEQTLKVTNLTTIKTSAGPASQINLKIGDHVTVVVYENETASAILVCNP
jgi:glycopeptide antibiotics resistance protein